MKWKLNNITMIMNNQTDKDYRLQQLFENKHEFGVPCHEFILPFDETFRKSAYQIFKCFIENPLDNNAISLLLKGKEGYRRTEVLDILGFKKWIIVSDYVFDKNKPQDVITFSIMPYVKDFNELKNKINTLQKKDIKHSDSINPEFIKFFQEFPIFNISISINKKFKLFTDEKFFSNQQISAYIKQINHWIENEKSIEKYIKQKKTLIKLLEIFNKKGPSFKEIRRIFFIGAITTYLMYLITSLIPKLEVIGWFSDRDTIIYYKEKELGGCLIFQYIQDLYHAFCGSKNLRQSSIAFGLPEEQGEMWFDELVRLPDFIAGTLADYNKEENEFSHDKFIPLFEKVFTNENKNLIFNVFIGKNNNNFEMRVNRATFDKI